MIQHCNSNQHYRLSWEPKDRRWHRSFLNRKALEKMNLEDNKSHLDILLQ